MIDQIVVPYDGSDESERALVAAPVLAARAGAEVELIAVGTSTERELYERRLDRGARQLGATWRFVESDSDHAMALIRALKHGRHELWCVGSHARGAIGEMVAGSVSEDLVRKAHRPIVLVGPNATAPPQGRVLVVAIDSTAEAAATVHGATAVASELAMSLRLLRIVRPGGEDMVSDSTGTSDASRVASDAGPYTREDIDEEVLRTRHFPVLDVAAYVRRDPEVGMIVVTTSGRRGRARLVHPSTALDLARQAIVPVLIVRPPS